MYYRIPVLPLPVIDEAARVIRKTVWRCADKRSILVLVQSGSADFTINGRSFIVEKGQMLLIPAEHAYIRRPHGDAPCNMFYIHFTTAEPITPMTREEMREQFADTATSVDERYIFLPPVTQTGIDSERALKLAAAIHAESRKNQYYNRLLMNAKLLELLIGLGRTVLAELRTGDLDPKDHYPPQIRQAIDFINKSYKQKITVEALCELCNVSPQHLIRLFRKHLNTTPIRYINKNKVFHAIEMLRTTDLSIKEIAYELGFDDPNYFGRIFKKEEKMSPAETRKRIRNYDKEKRPSPAE